MGHQIVSERITGKVRRKITTRIESVTWVDEEILPRLEGTIEREARHQGGRYPDAQMYLTGSTAEDGAQASSLMTQNRSPFKLNLSS